MPKDIFIFYGIYKWLALYFFFNININKYVKSIHLLIAGPQAITNLGDVWEHQM